MCRQGRIIQNAAGASPAKEQWNGTPQSARLEPFLAEAYTRQELSAMIEGRGMRAMALDWSKCPAVESVPGKVSGAWVFRGTRIPVAAVFENLEDGLTIDEVAALYDGLTREQVKAVLEFTAQSLETPSFSR
jgi:uncharacterized protein (DUF433 family)